MPFPPPLSATGKPVQPKPCLGRNKAARRRGEKGTGEPERLPCGRQESISCPGDLTAHWCAGPRRPRLQRDPRRPSIRFPPLPRWALRGLRSPSRAGRAVDGQPVGPCGREARGRSGRAPLASFRHWAAARGSLPARGAPRRESQPGGGGGRALRLLSPGAPPPLARTRGGRGGEARVREGAPPPPPPPHLASSSARRTPLLSCSAAAAAAARLLAGRQSLCAPAERSPPPSQRRLPRPSSRPPPPPPPPSLASSPAAEARARRCCGHEWLELLHRQPLGGRHLPGCGHRGLQGRAVRLGRRAGEDLRQHHACRSEQPGGEGPQQPVCERADAGGPEVFGHSGQPLHGRRKHHGPAHQEHQRCPHLQRHGCHDQQDHRLCHGEGGHPWWLREQEVLRDGQSLAAVAVLTGLLVPSVVLLMEGCRTSKAAATARGPRPGHRGTNPGAGSPRTPTSPPHFLFLLGFYCFSFPNTHTASNLPPVFFSCHFFYHKSLLLPNFLVVTRCSFFD